MDVVIHLNKFIKKNRISCSFRVKYQTYKCINKFKVVIVIYNVTTSLYGQTRNLLPQQSNCLTNLKLINDEVHNMSRVVECVFFCFLNTMHKTLWRLNSFKPISINFYFYLFVALLAFSSFCAHSIVLTVLSSYCIALIAYQAYDCGQTVPRREVFEMLVCQMTYQMQNRIETATRRRGEQRGKNDCSSSNIK